ncbi:WD40-repeat-containing domain superfamily protein [Abortiporus biennis]
MQGAPGAEKASFLRAEAELILQEERKVKAKKIKDLGSPIKLAGIALSIQVRGNYAWVAENTAVARKIDLETGKTVQIFRGHTAPVTSLAFIDKVAGSGDGNILITGSWDKNINVWDVVEKRLISSTPAHSDFVKVLLTIPSLNLLISGSSDKIVRFWDLSSYNNGQPLPSMGSISSHTRPVESLDARVISPTEAVLYTADTMGVMKAWNLAKEEASGSSPARWKVTLDEEFKHHRTGINEIVHGNGQLWTASSDETVQVVAHPTPETTSGSSTSTKPIPPITHPKAVKAILPLSVSPLSEPYLLTGSGDVIRAYDISSPHEPELIGEVDAHWHDITALRLWMRQKKDDKGRTLVEPWVVSTSLDGTIRKWKLSELLSPPPPEAVKTEPVIEAPVEEKKKGEAYMTEEEERELAELMGDD